jgi:hypothetical protein
MYSNVRRITGLNFYDSHLGGATILLTTAFPPPISEMARALRGPGPRSSLDQRVAAVVATVHISSLDTNLQLSGLSALSQAVEEVTEQDHPLVRPDRWLRLACCRGKRFGLKLWTVRM